MDFSRGALLSDKMTGEGRTERGEKIGAAAWEMTPQRGAGRG